MIAPDVLENSLIVQVALVISAVLVVLGVLMAFYRLMLAGSARVERVVALDLLTTIGIGVIVLFAIYSNQSVLMDAALVTALVSFLGTVAIARYIEFRARED